MRTKVIGGVAVCVVVLAGADAFGLSRRDTSSDTAVAGPGSSAPQVSPTVPSTTTSTTVLVTTTTTLPAAEPGASGPDVALLQQRLIDLGFWLPQADGNYDADTRHAVVAFQKANGLEPDGVAGASTVEALANAARPTPRSTVGTVMEVDLTRQVLLLAVDGRVEWTFDASTGRVAGTTPVGDFKVYRQVNGNDHGPLGTLYRPKYFVRGVAVHGFSSVPSRPASHGCVRVTDAVMDWIWANDAMPIGTAVTVYR